MATRRQIDYAYDLAEMVGYDLSDVVTDMFSDRWSIRECTNEEANAVIDFLLMELESLMERGKFRGEA